MPKESRTERHTERVGVYVFITFAALALSLLMVLLTNCDERPAVSTPDGGSPRPQQTTLYGEQDGEDGKDGNIQQSAEPQTQSERNEYTVELTDEQASSLTAMALHDYAQDTAARFISPDTLEITANIVRDSLLELIENGGGAAATAARGLLPESFEAKVSVELSAEDGELRIKITGAEAFGIDIADYLPAGVEGKLNDVIRETLPDSAIVRSVEVSDGAARVTVEL